MNENAPFKQFGKMHERTRFLKKKNDQVLWKKLTTPYACERSVQCSTAHINVTMKRSKSYCFLALSRTVRTCRQRSKCTLLVLKSHPYNSIPRTPLNLSSSVRYVCCWCGNRIYTTEFAERVRTGPSVFDLCSFGV